MTRVHQVLSGAGPYDAVTAQALAWRAELAGAGLSGEVFAESIDPRVRGVRPLGRLDGGDLLVVHHSAHAPRLRDLLERPERRLLVYHNVTPARYFWTHHPGVAVACALGRAELPAWVRGCHALAAVSEFNARDLRDAGADEVAVVPPVLFDERLRVRPRPHPAVGDGPLVLCVGRLSPHKRHDLVIEAFGLYRRACAPDARLLVAGEPLSPGYRGFAERLVAASGAAGVTIAGGLPQAELNAALSDAAGGGVLLSMSEHEGFCIPLLEAFTYGVPVVARPAGAVPEVGGDAVLWTDEDADPAVAAELIDLAVRDRELRDELTRRGRERVGAHAWREPLHQAVEAALR